MRVSKTEFINVVVTWIFIVILPVLDNYDIYFIGFTTKYVSFIILSFLVIRIISCRKHYLWRDYDTLFMLFIIWNEICYVISSTPNDIVTALDIVTWSMLYFWIRNSLIYNTIFYALFGAGIIQATWGILQFIHILHSNHVYFEQTGSFGNPGIWGIYLAISALSAIYILRNQTKIIFKILITIGLACIMWGIILAHSRTAWLALSVGIICIFWMRIKSSFSWLQVIKYKFIIYTTLSIFSFLMLWGIYLIRPESVKGRLLIYEVSLSLFKTAPWFGHGLSSFESLYMLQQASWFQQNPDSEYIMVAGNNLNAFNEYIKIACEMGITGLLLFCSLSFLCIYHAFSKYNSLYSHGSILLMILVTGMFSYPFETTSIIFIFYMITGITANRTQAHEHLIHMPYMLRIVGILLIIVGLLTINTQYHFRRKIELMLQDVTWGKRSVTDHFFTDSYPRLKSSPDFLLAYGEHLYTRDLYSEATVVLERAYKLRPSSTLLCDLGLCYQRKKEYSKARNAFHQASCMTPAYILPRFYLFSLHVEREENKEARRIAQIALEMPVKIINTSVLRTRNIMREYLKEYELYNQKKEEVNVNINN